MAGFSGGEDVKYPGVCLNEQLGTTTWMGDMGESGGHTHPEEGKLSTSLSLLFPALSPPPPPVDTAHQLPRLPGLDLICSWVRHPLLVQAAPARGVVTHCRLCGAQRPSGEGGCFLEEKRGCCELGGHREASQLPTHR